MKLIEIIILYMLFSIFIDNFWDWRNERLMKEVDSFRFKEFKLIFVISGKIRGLRRERIRSLNRR